MPDSKNLPNPIDIYVGTRLKARRVMLKMNQDALANLVGVTFQQIQKYEAGHNRISASKLFMIATVLEVPVNFFFDGIDQKTSGFLYNPSKTPGGLSVGENTDPMIDKQALKLLSAYSKLGDEARDKIYDFILVMSRK